MTERVGALSEGAGKAVRLCLREFSLPAVYIQIDISVPTGRLSAEGEKAQGESGADGSRKA